MSFKKFYPFLLLLIFLIPHFTRAEIAPYPGQTLQISSHFNAIAGNPTWLLIIRDVDSGRVLPYSFEFKKNDNFWLAPTTGRSYKVTVSTLTFGPFAVIHNFCHLENGIYRDQSMTITLVGKLSPITNSFSCNVMKYIDAPYLTN
jgi:hypothetical protein